MRKHYLVVLFLFIVMAGHAQQGNLSGDLMMNVNIFQRDTNIKATGNQL